MADTRPNTVIPANQVVDLYAATNGHPQGAISVGSQMSVTMLGSGSARLYAGNSLSSMPDNSTGYTEIKAGETITNDSGDAGAFIWSNVGCTVNISGV